MNPEPAAAAPETLNVPLAALVNLAVEHWRLTGWASTLPAGGAALARHALRRMHDTLAACELTVRSMDGQPFDAGLAVRVVDTVDDPALPEGRATIAETVAPMVLWRAAVVRPAEVVVRRGTAGATGSTMTKTTTTTTKTTE